MRRFSLIDFHYSFHAERARGSQISMNASLLLDLGQIWLEAFTAR
jgi:hypothetical protein